MLRRNLAAAVDPWGGLSWPKGVDARGIVEKTHDGPGTCFDDVGAGVSEPEPPPRDDEALRAWDARLRKARERAGGAGRGRHRSGNGAASPGEGWAVAVRVGVDLLAALVVGVAIGWGLDEWLGTRPWLMVVFFFLGSAAGTMNVYRTMSGIGHEVGGHEVRGHEVRNKPAEGRSRENGPDGEKPGGEKPGTRTGQRE